MKHEHVFPFRPTRPPVCRKRRKASRLNPTDSFADLDPFQLSSGQKMSRARDGNVSDTGFKQEQLYKKKSRGNEHLLIGIMFPITRFSILQHPVFRFWASRFLHGTPLGKRAQSDRNFFNSQPADVQFVDQKASQFRLGVMPFSDHTETGFRLHGFTVSVTGNNGSSLSYFPFPLTVFSVFHLSGFPIAHTQVSGFSRMRFRFLLTVILFCADQPSVLQVPPLFVTGWKPYYIPLHPAKELALSGLSGVFGAALLTLYRGKKP